MYRDLEEALQMSLAEHYSVSVGNPRLRAAAHDCISVDGHVAGYAAHYHCLHRRSHRDGKVEQQVHGWQARDTDAPSQASLQVTTLHCYSRRNPCGNVAFADFACCQHQVSPGLEQLRRRRRRGKREDPDGESVMVSGASWYEGLCTPPSLGVCAAGRTDAATRLAV